MSIRAVNPMGSDQPVRSAGTDQRRQPPSGTPVAKEAAPAAKSDRVELSSLATSSASDAPKFKLSMSELRELVGGPPEKTAPAPKSTEKADTRDVAAERRDDARSARREETRRSETPVEAPSKTQTTARPVKKDDRRSDTRSRS